LPRKRVRVEDLPIEKDDKVRFVNLPKTPVKGAGRPRKPRTVRLEPTPSSKAA
jgi:hypothetical protein